jgi:hypothetical protein
MFKNSGSVVGFEMVHTIQTVQKNKSSNVGKVYEPLPSLQTKELYGESSNRRVF